MSVLVVIHVDGEPKVNHRWSAVPDVGHYVILGHGSPTQRYAQVVKPPIWFNNTQGDCVVTLHCKEVKGL